ncbi:zinc knuckle [Ancylostoma caninum]|uniref:Zinc knuckle n=1 Tax=Ancylostoma caninum TaxID=29170 RepID=A0A368GXG7_ANCCA|nr:zinc knuckle [Ancylostoma caninum]
MQGRQQELIDTEDGHERFKFQMPSFMRPLKERRSEIGRQSELHWRLSEPTKVADQQHPQDPGIFKGRENEDLYEFIRKFKRKYEEVVRDSATLIDILADDHLKGRAKTISVEYAQILLENVANWPEYVQLIGALHRKDPRQAYNEIKQLATVIEQSRRICGGEKGYNNVRTHASWRDRANAYARKDQQSNRNAAPLTGSQQHWDRAPLRPERGQEPTQETPRGAPPQQGRRCYDCSQYGHLAKECPRRRPEEGQQRRNSNQPRNRMSAIINNARNLAVKSMISKEKELVGKRTVLQTRLTGKEKTSGTGEDTAKVVQRVTIPPCKTAWVRVGCEKSETGEERILWPPRKEVADGVFKITNQEARVPIFNPSEEAIVLRKRRVRHMGNRQMA